MAEAVKKKPIPSKSAPSRATSSKSTSSKSTSSKAVTSKQTTISNGNKKRKRKKMTRMERVISTFAILLGVFAITYIGYYYLMNTQLFAGNQGNIKNNPIMRGKSPVVTDDSGNAIKTGTEPVMPSKNELVNILCVGFDESSSNTDVILVVSIDLGNKTVNMLQIPRDCYVPIGNTENRINAAYGIGPDKKNRLQNLVDVINSQFELEIDHYMTIGCNDIAKVVNVVGGIPIYVPQAIPAVPKHYDKELGEMMIAQPAIPKGQQVINGEQAQWLVRYRGGYLDADIGRERMQRVFFSAMLSKLKDVGIVEVAKMIPIIMNSDALGTDMTLEEMKELAKVALAIPTSEYKIHMIPGEGKMVAKKAVWNIYRTETGNLLNEYFRPYQGIIEPSLLPILDSVPDEKHIAIPFITKGLDEDPDSLFSQR